jgi:His-Xaa-Ser system protein HxsD
MVTTSTDQAPEFLFPTEDTLAVRLQIRLYPADAVARAAHRFTDRCFVQLEYEDDAHLVCRLKLKRPGEDLATLAGEFTNEALDQVLRAQLAAETEQLRLLLLAHAFSNTNILHPELDADEPADDPAGIEPSDWFNTKTS